MPEFYPHIVIHGGPETDVTVYMLPKLPVVRNVRVAIKGDDVPKVIFLSARNQLERTYAGLDGLPVAFVRRHERDIAEALQGDVQRQWVVKNYGLHVTPSLSLGEDTAIDLTSQTAFYDIRGGAYIDAGRDHSSDDDTVLMAQVGRKIGSHHEVYGACRLPWTGTSCPATFTASAAGPRRDTSSKALTTASTCGCASPWEGAGPCAMTVT